MAKERAHIIAMLQGKPMGYVKSVSYTKRTFTLTKNKSEAKGYVSADAMHREIDELTKIGFQNGYTFIYD